MSATAEVVAPPTADSVAAGWQRRRGEFSHDWLRNRFLPRLHACAALAAPGVHANPRMIESLRAVIREWPERGAEALQLAAEVDEAMSPWRAVEERSSRLRADTASFIHCTSTELWRIRHGVTAIVREVRAAHADTERCFDHWTQTSSIEALRGLAVHAERLARALSKLPSRVFL